MCSEFYFWSCSLEVLVRAKNSELLGEYLTSIKKFRAARKIYDLEQKIPDWSGNIWSRSKNSRLLENILLETIKPKWSREFFWSLIWCFYEKFNRFKTNSDRSWSEYHFNPGICSPNSIRKTPYKEELPFVWSKNYWKWPLYSNNDHSIKRDKILFITKNLSILAEKIHILTNQRKITVNEAYFNWNSCYTQKILLGKPLLKIMDRFVPLPWYSRPGTKAILFIFGSFRLIFYRISRPILIDCSL